MQLAVSGGKSIKVSETTFGREFSEPLVHQVVTAYLAGARAGTLLWPMAMAWTRSGSRPTRWLHRSTK